MGLLIDGLIILIYFVLIIGIGLTMGRREKSLSDFALGGRNIPWWAVMASIIAAETSAATFLGAPGEGFEKKSLAYVQLTLGLIIGRFLVGPRLFHPIRSGICGQLALYLLTNIAVPLGELFDLVQLRGGRFGLVGRVESDCQLC